MIRWYDYVIAVVVADFMIATAAYALTVEIWYMSIIGSIAFLSLWDFWKIYCEWRKERESQR